MSHRGICASISDWEVVEMYVEHVKLGTPYAALGKRYGLTEKTVQRAFAKLKRIAKEMGFNI
jgi:hypothetical protein